MREKACCSRSWCAQRRRAGEYQIVAGERRWRARQRAGLRTVPIMVRELDDLAVLEIGIIENVQRADLNVLEEALSYKVLMEKFERTQEAIAQTIGKSRSHVAEAPCVCWPYRTRCSPTLVGGELSAGHARAIAAAADPVALAKRDHRGRPVDPRDRSPGPQGADRNALEEQGWTSAAGQGHETPRRSKPTCRRFWAWMSRSTIAARPEP
ncbi:ParB/RepB/Spo0J family partition protein [Caulobacter segnis]